MNPDEKFSIREDIRKAIESAKRDADLHPVPSPETRKFMEETKGDITIMKKDIEEINERLCKIPTKDELTIIVMKAQESVLECADKKYATKERLGNVEKIVYGMAGAILLYFLNAILKLI